MRFNKRGNALVEFAVVVPVLFFFLFGIMDAALMLYVNLTMQHAIREATRFSVIGQSKSAVVDKLKEKSNGLYDKNIHNPKEPQFNRIDPTKVTFANYSGTPITNGTGDADEVIVVSLTYTWPLATPVLKPFFPPDGYTFTVRSTMKNESWR